MSQSAPEAGGGCPADVVALGEQFKVEPALWPWAEGDGAVEHGAGDANPISITIPDNLGFLMGLSHAGLPGPQRHPPQPGSAK